MFDMVYLQKIKSNEDAEYSFETSIQSPMNLSTELSKSELLFYIGLIYQASFYPNFPIRAAL
jgi:hypothetical protein